jgi:hypothetical protein
MLKGLFKYLLLNVSYHSVVNCIMLFSVYCCNVICGIPKIKRIL